jgi:hypothetical protein
MPYFFAAAITRAKHAASTSIHTNSRVKTLGSDRENSAAVKVSI